VPVEAARTIAVNILVIGEIVYLFNCRHLTDTALTREGFLGNRYVLLAAGLLVLLQLGFTYLPFMHRLFGTAALDLAAWWRVGAFGVVLFLVVEMEKLLLRRNHVLEPRRSPA
jgi:magnesium-transporting ATPase (P-type)